MRFLYFIKGNTEYHTCIILLPPKVSCYCSYYQLWYFDFLGYVIFDRHFRWFRKPGCRFSYLCSCIISCQGRWHHVNYAIAFYEDDYWHYFIILIMTLFWSILPSCSASKPSPFPPHATISLCLCFHIDIIDSFDCWDCLLSLVITTLNVIPNIICYAPIRKYW